MTPFGFRLGILVVSSNWAFSIRAVHRPACAILSSTHLLSKLLLCGRVRAGSVSLSFLNLCNVGMPCLLLEASNLEAQKG